MALPSSRLRVGRGVARVISEVICSAETSRALPTQTPHAAPDRKASLAEEQLPNSISHPKWQRFVIPSVSNLLFVALLLALSCGMMGGVLLRDSDIGWHIRNGEQMLLTHAITRTDSFSSTMGGHTWYAWEWLYDVLIAVIHHLAGLNGVVFFTAAIIAATFALTLHLALRHGANLFIALFLLVLSLGASAVHFLARPHVLTWLFAVIWFDLLDSAAATRLSNKRLLWLPALTILWANVHGGFVLGLALLAIYLVGAAIEYLIHHEQRPQIRSWLQYLAGLTALCIAASFVNPYGYHLQVHIYRYLADRFLMNQISEFLSPDFHGGAQQCFAILLTIAIVSLATTPQRPSTSRLLVLGFAGYSALVATRNLPTSSLLITLVLAPMVSVTMVQTVNNVTVASRLRRLLSAVSSFGFRMHNFETSLRGNIWVVIVLAGGVWPCLHNGRFGSAQFINAHFDEKRFPARATDFISAQHIGGPVFSLDYWGGYLIYRLYPNTKVVADDRHDLYGDQFIKNYLKIVRVQPTFAEELDRMNVDWVLVPRWSSLANVLRLLPNWSVEHEDATAVLFHRK